MRGKKLDWWHVLAAVLITALLLFALWKRTATESNDVTKIQAPAGPNAMTQDPNSP
jgi:hypothetical protein